MVEESKITKSNVDFTYTEEEKKAIKARNPVYTWEEIKKHNKFNDSWLVAYDKVYDVTEWAKRHPGGDMILLGGGLDCTIQLQSYHLAGISETILKKYCVGLVDKQSESYYNWENEFYPTLKKRVLEKLGTRRRGGLKMLIKAFTILFFWCLSWYYAFVQGSFVAAAFFGFWSSQIGVSIMHDGSHGAFSYFSPKFSKIASYGMDLIGSSSTTWEFQHIIGHHPFTNLGSESNSYQNDPDIFSSYPMIKMSNNDGVSPSWYHRYQHIYGVFLFALFTMVKVFHSDFDAIVVKQKVAQFSVNARVSDPSVMTRFWIFKAITLTLHVGVGIFNFGWVYGLALIGLAHLVCGEFLALMFVVTHISEDCTFLNDSSDVKLVQSQVAKNEPDVVKFNEIKRDWAALQVMTSTNWALKSSFWTHVSGGLNHQIEHHLFPGICHLNYPIIQSIVQQTCEEFKVPYHAHETLYSAIKSMLNMLYISGNSKKEN